MRIIIISTSYNITSAPLLLHVGAVLILLCSVSLPGWTNRDSSSDKTETVRMEWKHREAALVGRGFISVLSKSCP